MTRQIMLECWRTPTTTRARALPDRIARLSDQVLLTYFSDSGCPPERTRVGNSNTPTTGDVTPPPFPLPPALDWRPALLDRLVRAEAAQDALAEALFQFRDRNAVQTGLTNALDVHRAAVRLRGEPG